MADRKRVDGLDLVLVGVSIALRERDARDVAGHVDPNIGVLERAGAHHVTGCIHGVEAPALRGHDHSGGARGLRRRHAECHQNQQPGGNACQAWDAKDGRCVRRLGTGAARSGLHDGSLRGTWVRRPCMKPIRAGAGSIPCHEGAAGETARSGHAGDRPSEARAPQGHATRRIAVIR